MKFELAVLSVLAKAPRGRATIEDVRREVEVLTSSEDQSEEFQSSHEAAAIDIFRSGLVIQEGNELQITETGRSLLRALETSGEPSVEASSAPTSQSLKLIDALIGLNDRMRIFALEHRAHGENTDFDPMQDKPDEEAAVTEAPAPLVEADADELHEITARQIDDEIIEHDRESEPTGAPETSDATLQNAPAFLKRGFGSKPPEPVRASPRRRYGLFAYVAANIDSARRYWHHHLEREAPNANADRRGGGAAVLAFLGLMVIVIFAGAAIALSQIRALKSEIAALQRELLSLKERTTRLDETGKANGAAEKQTNTGIEKGKASAENRGEQAALNLSADEIQLIKEYIKPAPFSGTALPPINVGDPVSRGTIPLPSPLIDKVPKLFGARFAIWNGAIIIVKRDSRQADAVLGPN